MGGVGVNWFCRFPGMGEEFQWTIALRLKRPPEPATAGATQLLVVFQRATYDNTTGALTRHLHLRSLAQACLTLL